MKKLMVVILMAGVLMTVMAQETKEPQELINARTSYQSQVKFALQAYQQKLEGMKKQSGMGKYADVLQAEIDSLKGQAGAAPTVAIPDQAPGKPGVKVTKLAEFPMDLTVAEWDKLPGKVVKVDALDEPGTMFKLKAGENIYIVPHPTDKWKVTPKESCDWKGLDGEIRGNGRTGTMIVYISTDFTKRCSSSVITQAIYGPMTVTISCWMHPREYCKGSIRVKLVPAEDI